jgi:hypothetical protein
VDWKSPILAGLGRSLAGSVAKFRLDSRCAQNHNPFETVASAADTDRNVCATVTPAFLPVKGGLKPALPPSNRPSEINPRRKHQIPPRFIQTGAVDAVVFIGEILERR